VTPHLRVSVRPVLLIAALALIAGCGPGSTSTTNPVAATGATVEPETPAPTSVAVSTEAALADQTDTEWGRIWDKLPAGFPVYAGSTAADEAATGPVSGIYALPTGDAATIATWFKDRLEAAGFSTEAMTGPLEDGGYVLDSTGSEPGCRTEVTVAPLGGTISVTILYGAACAPPR
jgi:hypothetical protein